MSMHTSASSIAILFVLACAPDARPNPIPSRLTESFYITINFAECTLEPCAWSSQQHNNNNMGTSYLEKQEQQKQQKQHSDHVHVAITATIQQQGHQQQKTIDLCRYSPCIWSWPQLACSAFYNAWTTGQWHDVPWQCCNQCACMYVWVHGVT